jgi:hypothetical protein
MHSTINPKYREVIKYLSLSEKNAYFDHQYKNKAGLAHFFIYVYGRTGLPQYKNLYHI